MQEKYLVFCEVGRIYDKIVQYTPVYTRSEQRKTYSRAVHIFSRLLPDAKKQPCKFLCKVVIL